MILGGLKPGRHARSTWPTPTRRSPPAATRVYARARRRPSEGPTGIAQIHCYVASSAAASADSSPRRTTSACCPAAIAAVDPRHAPGRRPERHRHLGGDLGRRRRRQDRHDLQLRRRVVRGLDAADHDRGVGRLSQQADPDDHRSTTASPVEGGTFPANIWHDFMVQALQIVATEALQAASTRTRAVELDRHRHRHGRLGHRRDRRHVERRRPAAAPDDRQRRRRTATTAGTGGGTGGGARRRHRRGTGGAPAAAPAAAPARPAPEVAPDRQGPGGTGGAGRWRHGGGGGGTGGGSGRAAARRRRRDRRRRALRGRAERLGPARRRGAPAARRSGCPRREKRHGSSAALVIPIRRSTSTSTSRHAAGAARDHHRARAAGRCRCAPARSPAPG